MPSLDDKQSGALRRAALAVLTLWWREMTRFLRQRSRWGSALAQPLVFWVLLGGGMQASFRPADAPAGTGYMLCIVLQGGVYDLDGVLRGCVQWSPRQAQRGLLLCDLCA